MKDIVYSDITHSISILFIMFMKNFPSLSKSLGWFTKIIMLIFCIFIPSMFIGGVTHIYQNHMISVLVIVLTFTLSNFTLKKIQYFPGYQTKIFIIPTVGIWFAVLLLIVMCFRLPYSRSYVIIGGITVIFFVYLIFYLNDKKVNHVGYIPSNDKHDLRKITEENFILIHEPQLPAEPIDYLIVDLNHPNLTDRWLKFISNCSLQGIIVINSKQLLESYTGRVTLDHLSENDLGTLQPLYLYSQFKRLIDVILIMISLPMILPVILLTMIIIKLESKGPIFFTQKRVGQYGKEFKIYKFRSMYLDSEEEGAKFASLDDNRVTPFGKIIRKLRIDELPQFINILKGNMSLIGPRPEQKTFVEKFEDEIPFYNYRHIVKPGISGWAQVNQGYTANTEETYIKTEYDFFYIKHFSFSLDFLIFLKTIKTILTGFGAR